MCGDISFILSLIRKRYLFMKNIFCILFIAFCLNANAQTYIGITPFSLPYKLKFFHETVIKPKIAVGCFYSLYYPDYLKEKIRTKWLNYKGFRIEPSVKYCLSGFDKPSFYLQAKVYYSRWGNMKNKDGKRPYYPFPKTVNDYFEVQHYFNELGASLSIGCMFTTKKKWTHDFFVGSRFSSFIVDTNWDYISEMTLKVMLFETHSSLWFFGYNLSYRFGK